MLMKSNSASILQKQQFKNTVSFENVLKKALELQDGIIKDIKNPIDLPKINKSSRSFKDIAEVLLAQMDFIRKKSNFSNLKSITVEDVDATTTGTQHDEEVEQLTEILNQKESIIDLLQKEKTYYIKKIEQLTKQLTSQSTQQSHFEDLETKFEQTKTTIQTQKELNQKQQIYIEELERKIKDFENQNLEMQRNVKPMHFEKQQLNLDERRLESVQARMIEDLVNQMKKLKEDNCRQSIEQERMPREPYPVVSPKLEILIDDIYNNISSSYNHHQSLEDKLQEIKHYLESKQLDKKKDTMNEQRFAQFVNLNQVDSLYRDFFDRSSHLDQVEHKNRCFKDLYNIFEECISKFHELFISYQATKAKIQKYEETFQQLDKVFSQEGTGEDDGKVLEDLRRLGNVYLQQIFDLQREISLLKSVDGMPIELIKLMKKSYQKKVNKTQAGGILNLEEQVNNLNEQLREQESILRQKERKLNQQRNKSKGHNTSTNVSHAKGFKSLDRSGMKSNTNNQQHEECIMNLNKALDRIFELEEINDSLEKEKSLHQLEFKKLREEYERCFTEKKSYEQRIIESEKSNEQLRQEKTSLSQKIKDLNDHIEKLEKEVSIQGEKAKKVSNLNEELRGLIEQERNAYNEEIKKQEEDFENLKKSTDTKIRLARNKLLMLIAADGIDQDCQQLSLDDVVKKICDYINMIKSRSQQFNNKESSRLRNISTANYNKDISPCKPSIKINHTQIRHEESINESQISGFFKEPSQTITPSKYQQNISQHENKSHFSLRQTQFQNQRILTQNDIQKDMSPFHIDEQYQSRSPLMQKTVTNYSSVSGFKDLSQSINKGATQQPYKTERVQDNILDPSVDHKKKNIDVILNNFKKEKEQFNEKLTQLRSKLQNVQTPSLCSPDQSQRIPDTVSIHSNQSVISPVVDNRRAKTLQKLKTAFGQNSSRDDQVQMRQFQLFSVCK